MEPRSDGTTETTALELPVPIPRFVRIAKNFQKSQKSPISALTGTNCSSPPTTAATPISPGPLRSLPSPTEPRTQTAIERCLATDAKSPPRPRQLPRQVPYQSSPQPLPRPPPLRPLMHTQPRRIGDDHCRHRRAPACQDIAPSQTRRHHAAAGTPRTTACLTALSQRPLLTLPAAPRRPPRRIATLRAPCEPR